MTAHHEHFKKSALALAAMIVAGVAPSQQAMAANCTWNPATGNWSSASDWSCGIVPTGGPDTAIIGGSKVVTVNTAQSILNLTNSGGVNIDAVRSRWPVAAAPRTPASSTSAAAPRRRCR